MFRFLVASILSAWLAASFQFACADSDSWQLAESHGVVRVMVPGTAIAKARSGMELPTGTLVTTGKTGTATLVRNDQRINIASESRLVLSENSDAMTRIRQDAGSAAYEVDRRKSKHFRVDTALIAAVVKGTVFTVSASPEAGRVHVSNGLVEVRSQGAGNSVDVHPGETASIVRSAPDEITVRGPKDASNGVEGLNVPPIDYAEASENLLEPVEAGVEAAQDRSNGNQGLGNSVANTASEGSSDEHAGGPNANAAAAAFAAATNARNASLNGNGADKGNGNGNGNGAENGNGNGNGNGAENGNGNGNGNGAENGNGNGNGNGAENGNGNGNGNGAENGNGNGNGNGDGSDDFDGDDGDDGDDDRDDD